MMSALSIPVKMDKPRNLKFGIEAMVALEELTGKGFLEVAYECTSGSPKITTIRNMLWAGLKHEDPELTPDKVSKIMDETPNIPRLIVAIDEAVKSALKEQKSDKKKLGSLFKRFQNM